MLIRKVFGGFNLFCFPDVDSRPGKRALQKKATCSKKRHSAGETCHIPDPRREATVGLNEHWLQQALSAEEAAAPASAGTAAARASPCQRSLSLHRDGPSVPRSPW